MRPLSGAAGGNGHRKIFVLDEHPIVISGIKSHVESSGPFSVVGSTTAAEGLGEIFGRLNPEIAIVGLSLGNDGVADVMKTVRREHPHIRMIAYTMQDKHSHVAAALAAGVNAYVSKSDHPDELIEAIRAVDNGMIYLSKGALKALHDHSGEEYGAEVAVKLTLLTPNEKTVLRLIASGKHNKEIAEMLDCSVRTVEARRESLMAKLGIHTAAGLTIFAIKTRLLKLEEFELP
jgi:DNA-binding NarL/FixJ family response regulator